MLSPHSNHLQQLQGTRGRRLVAHVALAGEITLKKCVFWRLGLFEGGEELGGGSVSTQGGIA